MRLASARATPVQILWFRVFFPVRFFSILFDRFSRRFAIPFVSIAATAAHSYSHFTWVSRAHCSLVRRWWCSSVVFCFYCGRFCFCRLCFNVCCSFKLELPLLFFLHLLLLLFLTFSVCRWYISWTVKSISWQQHTTEIFKANQEKTKKKTRSKSLASCYSADFVALLKKKMEIEREKGGRGKNYPVWEHTCSNKQNNPCKL